MLLELKYVEAHIEPEEILIQALTEGDISTATVVSLCVCEDGADAVLEAVENDDIRSYCNNRGIYNQLEDFESITKALVELSQSEKAQLVWMLLKCEG